MNENCCSVDWARTIPGGGGGICPLPSSHRGAFGSLSVPTPREFAIQEKKNANARGLARGGGAWAQLELTDALRSQREGCNFSI